MMAAAGVRMSFKADDQKFEEKDVKYWPKHRSKAAMVGWYSGQLLRQSAVDVLLTSLLGARVDGRLFQVHLGDQPDSFDHDEVPVDEFWFDYVADVGEGWNPTYAVAVGVSHGLSFDGNTKRLKLEGSREGMLPAGELLVMGGDEIYPSASHSEYERRLLRPYIAAAVDARLADVKQSRPPRWVYAIPGNHDWYDGLVGFSGIFLQQRRFGQWETRQRRSYFALKLPHGWWLIALDIPPERPIDEPQKQWIERLAADIKQSPDAKLIICLSDPVWRAPADARRKTQHNLLYVEDILRKVGLRERIRLRISGDYHHYDRHEPKDAPVPADPAASAVNITCGGGGAFLHPTHGHKASVYGDTVLKSVKSYPDHALSLRLSEKLLPPRSFGLMRTNPWLFGVIGALYGALAFTYVDAGWSMYILWVLIAALGFLGLASADPPSKTRPLGPRWLWLAGTNLALAFLYTRLLLAVFLLWPPLWSWVALEGCTPRYAAPAYDPLDLSLTWPIQAECMAFHGQLGFALVVASLGALTSVIVVGIYMYAYLRRSGVHWNEAFSLLQLQSHKCFMRIKITKNELRAYVIGLEQVPREWHFNEAPRGRLFNPGEPDSKATLAFQVVDEFSVPPTEDAAGKT
jgi:hypothetical protein